jgi:hypothetical protein
VADVKITGLAPITVLDPAVDPLPIVDVSDTSMSPTGTTKKVTVAQLFSANPNAEFTNLTVTNTITVGNDVLIGSSIQVGDLTANQVVFADGSKYLQTKTPVDARTALQTTTYTHVQSVSANPWVITHNLNAYPTVWVIDPLGRAGWTEVEYVNANTVRVHFPGAQTGTAYLNF